MGFWDWGVLPVNGIENGKLNAELKFIGMCTKQHDMNTPHCICSHTRIDYIYISPVVHFFLSWSRVFHCWGELVETINDPRASVVGGKNKGAVKRPPHSKQQAPQIGKSLAVARAAY